MKKNISVLIVSILLTIQLNAQTWNQVPSGTTNNLNAISFPSASVGYIVGNDSVLLKTTDGGLNWSQMDMQNFPFSPTSQDLLDVQFLTNDIGYLTAGPYAGTLKTIDGGITWTYVNPIYICFNHGLYFFDENNGFLGGSGCFSGEIINKLDTGTWVETNVTPQFIQSLGMINNFYFYDDSMGMATSSTNLFFRTTNGGSVWDTINSGLPFTDKLTSVLFTDSVTVLATYKHAPSASFGVLISNDAGLTWQDHVNTASFSHPNMYATEKSGNGHVFVGGVVQDTNGVLEPGIIFESDHQMVFWLISNVDERISDFGSRSDSVVFAIGDNGYIIVNQPLAGLSLNEKTIEENIVVFPNPSTGEIHIKNDISVIDAVRIYDMRGSEIDQISQIKTNDWSIENLNPGVYLVKVSSNNHWYSKKVVIF